METRIPRGVLTDIQAHAREAYPEECCGFLIGRAEGEDRTILEHRRARNVHPEMRHARYTVDPRDVWAVARDYRGEVEHVGFYHSHPDGAAKPSSWDLERAWRYYVYGIVAVDRDGPGEFAAWVLDEPSRTFRPVAVRIL